MLLPVIPFFATDMLGLDYGQYALAKGVIGQLGILFLSPFLAVRLQKLHPFRFTGVVCLLLALFPMILLSGNWIRSPWIFYAAFAVFAVAMAGIGMSWNISSLHFAPKGQEATYQGLHISMTALRASFAPIMGSLLLSYGGYVQAFAVSAVLFILAGSLFLRRHRMRVERGMV
jgi:predicted MFS family arabinose efflux permease